MGVGPAQRRSGWSGWRNGRGCRGARSGALGWGTVAGSGEGTYEPSPVRQVLIPKKQPGKFRPLGIPCLRDRVAQTSAMLVLSPIFEADLEPEQYGYRPGRSAKDAVRRNHPSLVVAALVVVLPTPLSAPSSHLLGGPPAKRGAKGNGGRLPAQKARDRVIPPIAGARRMGEDLDAGEPTREEDPARAGLPPFKSVFPAFPVRSSRVQCNGRKRRSCSPV